MSNRKTLYFKTLIKKHIVLISIALLTACGDGSGDDTGVTGSVNKSEGTPGSPVLVSLTSAHYGSIDQYALDTTPSYYTFTTGAFSGSYQIALSSTSSDLSWDLYSESDYINGLLFRCDTYITATDEICSVNLNSSTTYYILVDNWDSMSSTFYLTISPLDPLSGCQNNSSTCFDFETGTAPTNFVKSGNVDWAIDGTNAATGTYSYRSGAISDNQISCFEYSASIETSQISFSVKTDSEANWDKLIFYIDNVAQTDSWSGNNDWQRTIFSSTLGIHTYKWCYEKDHLASMGTDTVWVDDIELN